jgi:hypothetical protein
MRFKWMCRRDGHKLDKSAPGVVDGPYGLCKCGLWFDTQAPYSSGFTLEKLLISTSMDIDHTITARNIVASYVHPFSYLRNNPDVLSKMDWKQLRLMIVEQFAKYEEGLDE